MHDFTSWRPANYGQTVLLGHRGYVVHVIAAQTAVFETCRQRRNGRCPRQDHLRAYQQGTMEDMPKLVADGQ